MTDPSRATGARVSTVLAAFASIAVIVIGAHAWGQPSNDATASVPDVEAAATSPLFVPLPSTITSARLPGADAAGDGARSPDGGTALPAVTAATAMTDSGLGTMVATGTGPVIGDPGAPLWRYTVEVDPAVQAEMPSLLAVTDRALGDVTHGWTAQGQRSLQRTEDPSAANIRIVLAPPARVDGECAQAGLDTVGFYSCWDGWQTMLNHDRWMGATADFTDLDVYRTYLVNHEFGHGLGYDHEYCPGPGMVAPVMMQQSMGLQGCTANGLAFP